MTHEEKKITKIVEELSLFFFAIGANSIKSGIEKEDKQVVIEFESDYNPEYREKAENLNQYLNGEKNQGMEDIYWELAGSGDPGETNQLLLVGMMIDKADISIEDTRVRLKLHKELL